MTLKFRFFDEILLKEFNNTLLMLAVNESHVDIVRFLLSQPNIDVNCMEIITLNHLLHLKINIFDQI